MLAYTPLRRPAIAGVIATGPSLKTVLEEQKVKVVLAKVLGKVFPTFTLKNGVDAQMLSRNPSVAEAYINDPLVHPFVTASWGKAMLRLIDLVYQNSPRFPLPLLLIKDEIAYPTSSTTFAELAPKDKVTLKMWDGFKHELHNDPENAQVFKVMIDWLNQH